MKQLLAGRTNIYPTFGVLVEKADVGTANGFANPKFSSSVERKWPVRSSSKARFLLPKLASFDAANHLQASCPTEMPQAPIDRFDAAAKRLDAMSAAIKTVRPALDSFYASLTDEQKAQFNMLGPPKASSSRKTVIFQQRSVRKQAGLVVMSVRSAIFCSRWAIAARLLSACDSAGRLTMIGAGFVAPGAAQAAVERLIFMLFVRRAERQPALTAFLWCA
jgi:hypothetical protein